MNTPQTLTHQETLDLLPAFKTYRNLALFLFPLQAGLRISETVQLLRSDLWTFDTPVHSLLVRSEIAKYHRPRLIPLTGSLQTLIAALEAYEWLPLPDDTTKWALTAANPRNHISVRHARRILTDTAQKVCKRKIYPHMLRHTFATRLMQTTNIRVVQELLGHKHLNSTQIYTHPCHQDLRDAIDTLQPST